MWIYRSPIGVLYIKQMPNGKYGLCYDSDCYGFYENPVQAADDVYTHVTGCYEWDILDGKVPDEPTDLGEWEKV